MAVSWWIQYEMDRWEGRVAVVTGASSGIGEALVRRLAASGIKVAALARRSHLLEELEKDVNKTGKTGKVRGFVCDVSSKEDVSATFKKIQKELGPVSILINNAAILKPLKLTDLDLNVAQMSLDTNITGVLNCLKSGLDSMKQNNITDGHIINISSIVVHSEMKEYPELSIYAATKSALNVISKNLKQTLTKDGLKTRVSTVSPGLVETEMTQPLIPDFNGVPHLKAKDIADAVEYILSCPPHVNVRDIIVEPV